MPVREATLNDVVGITEIYAHHVRFGKASFEWEPPDVDEMHRRVSALLEINAALYVEEDGGEIAGYAYAGPFRNRPGYRYTVENSVYVHPAHQRKGIGSRLLARLIEACTRQGYRTMIAVIGDSANVASIELHRAHGFRTIGTIEDVGFKFGGWLDSVMMQRDLLPRSAVEAKLD